MQIEFSRRVFVSFAAVFGDLFLTLRLEVECAFTAFLIYRAGLCYTTIFVTRVCICNLNFSPSSKMLREYYNFIRDER